MHCVDKDLCLAPQHCKTDLKWLFLPHKLCSASLNITKCEKTNCSWYHPMINVCLLSVSEMERILLGKNVGKSLSSQLEALFLWVFYIFSLIKSLLAVMVACNNVKQRFFLIINTFQPLTKDPSLLPCWAFFLRRLIVKMLKSQGQISHV